MMILSRFSSFAIYSLLLVGSAQAKTSSLFHVEEEKDATTTTTIDSHASSGNHDEKPVSLIEKARILRERRDMYRRSLQGGFSFTDAPTSAPTIRVLGSPTPEPTGDGGVGGKAGPYRTLQPTHSPGGGKAGPWRTTVPKDVDTLAPTAEPTTRVEPQPERSPRKKAIAIVLIGKKGRPTGGGDDYSGKGDDGKGDDGDSDDYSGKGDDGKGDDGDDSGKGDDGKGDDGKGDDGDDSGKGDDGKGDDGDNNETDGGSVSNLIKNWRANKAGSRRNLRKGVESFTSSSSSSSMFDEER